MAWKVALLVALLAWLFLPLACAKTLYYVGSRYMLQESGGILWELAAAALWLAVAVVVMLLSPRMASLFRSPMALLTLAFWTCMTGATAGPLAQLVVNCVGDRSEARAASVAKIDQTQRIVAMLTIGDPAPGVVFQCPKGTWLEGEAAGKRLFVHRGRLGLLWAELQ